MHSSLWQIRSLKSSPTHPARRPVLMANSLLVAKSQSQG